MNARGRGTLISAIGSSRSSRTAPMRRPGRAVLAATIAATTLSCATQRPSDAGLSWTEDFDDDLDDLTPTGRNPWFILEPGYVLELEHGDDRLVITVLPETRMIDGVETRIVEERETEGGLPVEVSRNFFAISRTTASVYYFGEDVDIYRDGAVVGHEGAWQAGVGGARPGMMMPGVALIGARHYQEIAPGVAMDRAEILSVTSALDTPAGRFTNIVRVAETTPLEPGELEYKYYARGVGLLRDGDMLLTRYGFLDRR